METLKKYTLNSHYKRVVAKKTSVGKGGSLTPREIILQMNETILKSGHINIKDTNFRVLDPACGTGSFLLAWYEILKPFHSHEHILNEMLWGFETDPGMHVAPSIFYKIKNVYKESFITKKAKGLKETDKLKDMKFDIVLLNPPYSNGLFIQFLNKGFSLLKDGGTLCAIHPSTYIISKKVTREKRHILLNNTIEKYKSSVKLVNGNSIFEKAGFFTPLSITTITKTEDPTINVVYEHLGESIKTAVTSVKDIWIHSNNLAPSIYSKIKEKMTLSLLDMWTDKAPTDGNLYLKVNNIAGNRPQRGTIGLNPDFNCIIYKTEVDAGTWKEELVTTKPRMWKGHLKAKNNKELENLYNYTITKFARFCVSLLKLGQNMHRGELAMTPYLDFSEEWTDEKCYKYFNLTEEEIEFIESYIKDWYAHDFK